MATKKPPTAGDLARTIRNRKLDAIKERDRYAKEDELDNLRNENAKLKSYCSELEDILRTTEAALTRMSFREPLPKFPAPPFPAPPPKPKQTRRPRAPKQTALPGTGPGNGSVP
jgi:hypothetical protein